MNHRFTVTDTLQCFVLDTAKPQRLPLGIKAKCYLTTSTDLNKRWKAICDEYNLVLLIHTTLWSSFNGKFQLVAKTIWRLEFWHQIQRHCNACQRQVVCAVWFHTESSRNCTLVLICVQMHPMILYLITMLKVRGKLPLRTEHKENESHEKFNSSRVSTCKTIRRLLWARSAVRNKWLKEHIECLFKVS